VSVDQPLVSVVLITYNHERYIAHAIESVLAQQTHFPYEILISEDCSTDSTRDVVRIYEQRYPQKIRLFFSQRNQCGNQVVSRALVEAKGKYVAYLDGDDYWTSTKKLQRQVDFLDRHPEHAICFHDVRTIYEPGTHEAQEAQDWPRPAAVTTLQELLREDNFKFYVCSLMLRNGLLKNYPDWFDSVYCTDLALTILHAEQGSVGYLDETMAVYRVHPNGAWSGLGAIERCQRNIELRQILKGYFGVRYSRLLRRTIAKHWYCLAVLQQASGHGVCARFSSEQGLAEWPFDIRLLLFRRSRWLWSLLKATRAKLPRVVAWRRIASAPRRS
jgi:glycosyltransferase involved in cell wall biosynthesis